MERTWKAVSLCLATALVASLFTRVTAQQAPHPSHDPHPLEPALTGETPQPSSITYSPKTGYIYVVKGSRLFQITDTDMQDNKFRIVSKRLND